MKKCEIYRMEREKGLTYREIAAKYGVSYQMIAQACGKFQPARFRYINEKACPFVNLREWLNFYKITRSELIRRLGMEVMECNRLRVNSYLSGKVDPPKWFIDKMIEITGLPYSMLFTIG